MSAVFFLDIDGTIFKHGTNDLLPGADKLLEAIIAKKGEIVFTTYRGDENFAGHKIYSREGAMNGIRSLKVPYRTVLFDIDSPRIVINDGGGFGITNNQNCNWSDSDIAHATSYAEMP